MPRLLGVEIPAKKKVAISLRYIYGIGPQRADQLVKEAGLDVNMRAQMGNFRMTGKTDGSQYWSVKTPTGYNGVDIDPSGVRTLRSPGPSGRTARSTRSSRTWTSFPRTSAPSCRRPRTGSRNSAAAFHF